MLQPNYNPATGRVELVGDEQANITMTATVPVAHEGCNILTFEYDHHVSGIHGSNCETHFQEGRLEHTLNVRVQPTPGCNSYTSLMEFKPFDRPGPPFPGLAESIWMNYVPSNITVRL